MLLVKPFLLREQYWRSLYSIHNKGDMLTTVLGPFQYKDDLYRGNPYIHKTASLYWDGTLVPYSYSDAHDSCKDLYKHLCFDTEIFFVCIYTHQAHF